MSPLPFVTKLPLWSASEKIALDVGAGCGRNAIFLARNGFKVDALDRSPVIIEKLATYVKVAELPIRTHIMDVSNSQPVYNLYSVILFTFILHTLTQARATQILCDARLTARSGTLHAIAAITNSGDFYKQAFSENRFYPSPEDICDLYQNEGWIIKCCFTENRTMQQLNTERDHMHNVVTFLIAQKP